MYNYEKGDSVIYKGLPNGLENGGIYLIEEVLEDSVILYNEGECEKSLLYPLREYTGNEENHPVYYEDRIAGVWTLPSNRRFISLKGLIDFYTDDRLMEVKLDDLDGCGLDLPERMRGENCACCGGERFITADAKKPLILFAGLMNPMGRPYRVMDGLHRIGKLRWMGRDSAMAYVLHIDEVLPYFN